MEFKHVIVVGAIIMIGVPIGLGLGLATSFNDPVLGIVAGVGFFLIIAFMGYQNMKKQANKDDQQGG